MNRELPKPGERYLHFKNKLYQVLCIAENSETKEKMVVYQALYGEFACYVRPLELFMSEVDHEKYPEISQKYRFEKVDDVKPQEACARSEHMKQKDQAEEAMLQEEHITETALQKEETEDAQLPQENSEEEQADPALLRFLDTDTLEEKYQLLKSMERSITNRLIDDFSVVLDLVIPEGSLDYRYHQLLSSIATMQRFENTRLR